MSACKEYISVTASLRIRSMDATDIMRVWAIEQAIYTFPWALDTFTSCQGANYTNQVVELYQRVAGYAVMQLVGEDCHLLNLGVESQFQRHGLGGSLLRSMLDTARSRGVRHAFLEVRPSNEVARLLYLREGFTEVGLRKGYYPASAGREDALVLARLL